VDEMKNVHENEQENAVTPDEITVSAMAQIKTLITMLRRRRRLTNSSLSKAG
jgi:hypothetical protein